MRRNYKNSFSLIELVFVIILISLLLSTIQIKKKDRSLDDVTDKLVIYLKHLRQTALIDNQFENSEKWYKKRWTLKFLNCSSDIGGIYYRIYSDKNMKGHGGQDESLKDPITNRFIYSSNNCKENNENSKYVLLTKNYDITKVDMTCNETKSIGQISFGSDGEVYTNLSEENNKLEVNCLIILTNLNNKTSIIEIQKETGYIKRLK